MNFFNKAPENTEEEFFYIPIVEQIRNCERLQSWSFAQHENRRRKFYPSPESLFQAESFEYPTVSCYKVSLTAAQKQQLAEKNNYFVGVLHFKASEIISLISFRVGFPFEQENPFLSEEKAVTAAAGP